MYNPHCCTVPSFYNVDYAQLQCLGQSLNRRTAAGLNQPDQTNEAVQTEFAFGMEFAKNSNLTPQSPPQITPRNNLGQPMHTMPWGEEALSF